MSDAPMREWGFYLDDMDDTLWSIVQDNVPVLLPLLESLRKTYQG